jgi:hypothetical protein
MTGAVQAPGGGRLRERDGSAGRRAAARAAAPPGAAARRHGLPGVGVDGRLCAAAATARRAGVRTAGRWSGLGRRAVELARGPAVDAVETAGAHGRPAPAGDAGDTVGLDESGASAADEALAERHGITAGRVASAVRSGVARAARQARGDLS